jgi:hypothetical protein
VPWEKCTSREVQLRLGDVQTSTTGYVGAEKVMSCAYLLPKSVCGVLHNHA